MKSKMTLILVILTVSIFSIQVVADPGDSLEEAIPAVIGENTGTLSDSQMIFFNFTGNGQYYEFSLVGPEESNFDLWVLQDDEEILGLYDTSYPDVNGAIITGDVSIRIFSEWGSGEFVLTISIVEPPSEVEYSTYSSALSVGDSFVWEGSFTEEGDHFVNFLKIDVINENLTQAKGNDAIFEATFTEDGVNTTQEAIDLFPYIIFESITWNNGTVLDMLASLEYTIEDSPGNISSDDDIITLTANSTEITGRLIWDRETGILISMDVNRDGITNKMELSSSTIELQTTYEGEVEKSDDDLELPLQISMIGLSLLCLPLYRRKTLKKL